MSLLYVIGILVALGVVLWAINAWIPMEPGIKKLINIVCLVVAVLWILNLFGLFAPLSTLRVGK